MAFDPKPVSLEEYNQSLRDSVNAYYVHAMNDPSMSREEAVSSTAQMAENYLNAVDEFQAAQAAQTEIGTEGEITSGSGTGVEDGIDFGEDLEGGEGCEDGMDM